MSAADDRVGAAPAASVLARHVAASANRRSVERAAAARSLETPPAPVARTPERAAGSAIARAAERVHGMALFLDAVTTSHAVVAELGELIPDQALIAVVEGRADALGAVTICPRFLTSLIEMQALGRVSSRPAVPRKPTRTDAAICTDFVNVCLAEIGLELTSHAGFEGLDGYRYANFLDDPRLLELMLEDVSYRLISISLRAGPAGQRDGRMQVILPVAATRPASPAIPSFEMPTQPAKAPGVLAESVHSVPIELFGILCRRRISLGELQALAPGDRITLPAGALGQATLETGTGQTLFRGRLGELAGHHALRISAAGAAASITMSEASFGADGDNGVGTALEQNLSLTLEPPILDLEAPDSFRMDEALGMLKSGVADFDEPASADESWGATELEPLAALSMQIG